MPCIASCACCIFKMQSMSMKINRLVFFYLLISLSLVSNAQFSVSGKVVDSATRELLPGASVFCHNTTIGTSTNKQGEFSLQLKSGGYDLIISYTGYQTNQVRISSDSSQMIIEMIKEEKNMSEVVIRSSNEVPD